MNELLEQAIQTWGPESQRRMAIEECAELIQALSKYERHPGPDAALDVVGEMVDVELMLEQLRWMFPTYEHHNARIRREKLMRLSDKLESREDKC